MRAGLHKARARAGYPSVATRKKKAKDEINKKIYIVIELGRGGGREGRCGGGGES